MFDQKSFDKLNEINDVQPTEIKEPIIKVGDVREDYGGIKYTVLEISNTYDEVSQYDWNGACLEFSTEEQLIEANIDPEDALYCAVKAFDLDGMSHRDTYVFIISRESTTLGD